MKVEPLIVISDVACPPNSSERSRVSEQSSQHGQGGSAEQVGGVVHHPLVRAGSSDHRRGSADRSHHSTRSHRPEYSNKHAGFSERGYSDTHHVGFSERHHGDSSTHSGVSDGYPGQRDFKHPNEYPPGFSEYPPISERSSRHEHGGSAPPLERARKERGGAEASSGAQEHAAREVRAGISDNRAAREEWQAPPPPGHARACAGVEQPREPREQVSEELAGPRSCEYGTYKTVQTRF